MPRPREFDRDQVLEIAQALFRQKGYEATSTEDLRTAMGIGRQSFYDAFGSKRQIFVEVLRLYSSESIKQCTAALRRAQSPLAALSELLLSFSKDTPEQRALGCLGVAAICDFGLSDVEIAEISRSNQATLESVLEGLLGEARDAGELRASVSERAAARQLGATILGMKVLSRSGASAEVLRDIATSALDGLAVPPVTAPVAVAAARKGRR